MKTTPTRYKDISKKAQEVQKDFNLTDTQTLLYNHICRGDFRLINCDGQKFYDKNNNGFGWRGDRVWVKNQFKPLIKNGLVEQKISRNCRDKRYTTWYFYCPEFNFNHLVDADNFVATHILTLVKYYLDLPDNFNKNNSKYGDMEFISEKANGKESYSIKYKGEDNVYLFDCHLNGIKRGKLDGPIFYENFKEAIYDAWSFLANDGYEYLGEIPGYTCKFDLRWDINSYLMA